MKTMVSKSSDTWDRLAELLANPVPTDVVGALHELGVEVVRECEKDSGMEVLARCPMHEARTGREDRHPSFWLNASTGAYICFSCQYQGNFTQLVVDGLNLTYGDAKRWIISRRRKRSGKAALRERRYTVDEREYLHMSSPPLEELENRRLSALAAEAYGVKWRDGAWVLPIFGPGGDFMGWQEKRGHNFINRPTEVKKSLTLFGYNRLSKGSIAVLTEAPLCAVRIGSAGYAGAVSSFGVQVSDAQMRLIQGRASSLILALDNPFIDKAGREMTEYLYRRWSARGMRIKCFNYTGMDGKDPSELSDAEVEFGIENACGLRSLKYVHG